jgi:DNA-binding NtrC family response regulator/Tfp pilus assembly protein PilF
MKENLKSKSGILDQKLCWIRSLIAQKEFKQAVAELRDLENQKEFTKLVEESEEFDYLFALALQGLGNYKEASSKVKKALALLKSSSQFGKFARAQYVLGTIYFDMGELKKAEQELRDAIASFRRIDDQKGIIDVLNELAHVHFLKSDYSKAIEYLTECISYCEQINDQKTKAKVSANLGRIYILVGNWKLAEANLLRATKIHEGSGNKVSFCNGLLSLGYVCSQQRDYRKADRYYQQAVKLILENSYTREFAIYHEYAGELEFAQGNFENAKNHYLDCIGLMQQIAPESDMISQTYRLLAELQIAEKQYGEALSSCEKALKVATSLGEKIEIGAIHRALGQIYTAKSEKEKAQENFEKSISILEQIGAKFELGKAYLEAIRSNAFEYVDRVVYYGNAREVYKELESDYWLGKVGFAFCEMLFETGEYEKVEVYLSDSERIFKRLNEEKDLDLILELKSKINKVLSKGGTPETSNRTEYRFSDIVTQNPQMLALLKEARKLKDLDVPILIEGETGTGKDLLAMAIHCESKRKNKRFVPVNCPAIPEHLLESELFGYKKGAFTGADKDKMGLFEAADGGTIFLNEIGDLPLRLQAKILDVIEYKRLTRLGEVQARKFDFRVMAATNRDLSKEVSQDNFRKDLYHRLNGARLKLPPLRERKEDIPLLIRHFLANSNIQIESQNLDFHPYLEYFWPGNVRELKNEFKKYTSISELVDGLSRLGKTSVKSTSGKLAEIEKTEILEVVKSTQNRREAAALLGISEATLYRKIKFYKLNQ